MIKTDEPDKIPSVVALVLIACGVALGLAIGRNSAWHDMEVEAVRRNAARWETTVEGRTKFMWNYPPDIEL